MLANFKNPHNTATQPDPWLLLCSASPADRALKITPTSCEMLPGDLGPRATDKPWALVRPTALTQAVGPQARGISLNSGFFNPRILENPPTTPSPPLRWGEGCSRCRRAAARGPTPCQYCTLEGWAPALRSALFWPPLPSCAQVPPQGHVPGGGTRWRSPAAPRQPPSDPAQAGPGTQGCR